MTDPNQEFVQKRYPGAVIGKLDEHVYFVYFPDNKPVFRGYADTREKPEPPSKNAAEAWERAARLIRKAKSEVKA